MAIYINDYKVLDTWHTVAEGMWAEGHKDGYCYFIKKYNNKASEPDSAMIGSLYSEAAFQRNLELFHAFKARRDRINESVWALTDHGGNIVIPFEYFVHEHTYTEVSDFYTVSMTEAQIVALPEEEKILLFRTLASTLKKIHALGLVHCDLKPSNVVCSLSGSGKNVFKLIDFGASFFEDDRPTDPEDFSGDQNYASPELAMVWMCADMEIDDPSEYIARVNTKTDVFSFGLVMHYFLCGEPPGYVDIDPAFKHEGRSLEQLYPFEVLFAGGRLEPHQSIVNPVYQSLLRSIFSLDPNARPTMDEVLEKLKEIPLFFTVGSTAEYSRTAVGATRSESVGLHVDDPWEDDRITWVTNISELLTEAGWHSLKRHVERHGKHSYCFVDEDGDQTPVDVRELIEKGFANAPVTETGEALPEYADTDIILRPSDRAKYSVNTEMLRSMNVLIKPTDYYNETLRKTVSGYELYNTADETKTFVSTTNMLLKRYLLYK